MARKRQIARKVILSEVTSGKYFKKEGFESNYIITKDARKFSRVSLVATIVDTYKNEAGTYGAITFDDGTDTIRGKYFQDLTPMDDVSKGEIVEIIGKVKEYGGEIYLVTEHLFRRYVHFELLRKAEYKQFKEKWISIITKLKEKIKANTPSEELMAEFGVNLTDEELQGVQEFLTIESDFEEVPESSTPPQLPEQNKIENSAPEKEIEEITGNEKVILGVIDELDDGAGAEYSQIIQKTNLNSEEVESLINNLLSDGTCYEPRPGKIKRL